MNRYEMVSTVKFFLDEGAFDTFNLAQENILIRSPTLLTSLLNIATSHNWLTPTLSAMRLHAYVTQAVSPLESQETSVFTQVPRITADEAKEVVQKLGESDIKDFIEYLEKSNDARAIEARKAAESWGRLELVEASFRGTCNRTHILNSD